MSSIDQGNTIADILKWESDASLSREKVTVLSGQDLALGTVLGKVTLGTCPSTGTAADGNTGAGTCTDVTASTDTKVGTYTLKAITAGADAVFSVEDPDGYALPNAITGTAYENAQINFTINDGSPDFAVGDSFTVVVPAGEGQVRIVGSDLVNGAQKAYGILYADVDASDADTEGVAIVRDAVIVAADLVWPDESPLPSTTWLAELAEKGIVERDEV
jgi:hypothetical protein